MINTIYKMLVVFILFASSILGLSKINAQTSPVPLGELRPFWRSQPVLGPYLQDGISTIEVPNYMLQTDFPYKKRSFTKEVPFADNLSVVRLLGGYNKYPGITGTLTDMTTSEGITLLNQLRAYDFAYKNNGVLAFRPELIQQRLQPYLALGYEDLTIVLDNIPWDLTTNTNASLSSYGNRGVPIVTQEWYDTVSQLCTTLIVIMGAEKANKLRFRIGTEMNGLERFNGTEAQFITHSDNAAAAIQSVLPGATLSLFNISSNTLSNINTAHNVGAFRVLNHIANENNQKTGAKLTNIPNFVSFSEYFYEGTNFTTEVSNSNQVWNYVNNNIPGYQNKFSREIHEFGGLADWNANPTTENEGAFGGAMTLQLFMKYMEVGVDRIYHWNSFKSIPNGPVRYQIPSSQAWIYSVLDYLSGGTVYKIIPDAPTIPRNATITSMLSVKSGKSYLLVNSFDTDKTNTQVSEVVIRIPKSYLPSISLAATKMTSLTNTNCVLNEIRRDVENAGNLNPLLTSKPNYIPSNLQDLCVDYTACKAMVLSNATKYENLWKESLTLKSLGGNITEEGTNFVIKLNMTASQNSVIVFQSTLTTWTGGTSASWIDATNWSTGIVPDQNTDVTIGTSIFQPTIASNVSIKSFTNNAGATLVVNSGYSFTVKEAITNNGTLTIKDDASLIQVDNVANTGVGSSTVNRKSNDLLRLDYTLWSSPVASQNLLAFSPATVTTRFYTYNTGTNLYNAIATPGSTPFIAGKGYLIRMPDNADAVTPTAFTGSFTGVPNNGTIPVPVTIGYNLVGNPYPSNISFSSLQSENSGIIGTTAYFWRKTNGTIGSAYCTYNTSGSTYISNGAPGAAAPGAFDGIIQSGQGFFVAATAAGNLNFTNTQRTSTTTNQAFFKTKQVTTSDKVWLNATNAAGDFSQMAVTYSAGATTGVDDFDSKYINDSAIALSSNINNEEYSIQGRPVFDATDAVALNFKTINAGDYTIALAHTEGVFANNQEVYLVDSKTGTETDLKTDNYTFTVTSGTSNARFSLKYQKNLKVIAPAFDDNSVSVYKNNGVLYVNSASVTINTIEVFDIQGRLLNSKKNVKSTTATINNLKGNQLLIVKVISEDNKEVSKKVVN
jgi:hypothetical protein